MADAIVRNESPGTEDSAVSAVSWAAIIACGLSSAAVSLVLPAFGARVCFSRGYALQNSGVSPTTFLIGTGLYFSCIAMIASSIDGYLAGRLRSRCVGAHSHEIY